MVHDMISYLRKKILSQAHWKLMGKSDLQMNSPDIIKSQLVIILTPRDVYDGFVADN